jgi:indoleacetamide hydrolase
LDVVKAMSSEVGTTATSAQTITPDEILELDCTDLVARIRDGSLRAEQVCATFLEQSERQRSLNVVTWIDPPQVLARARDIDRTRDKGAPLPALAGLPILVKDNIDTVGLPTSAGTALLKQYLPRGNAPVVEQLLQQGAVVMGKTNMHELGMGMTSSNPIFGSVRNPYSPDLNPGGSSGGSAAAIAARIAPAALGTDTAGSVRVPAALCGIVGFRPSVYPWKSYSQQGVVPGALALDTIGPMGRCVADVAMLHAAIVGERPARIRPLAKTRIGVPRLAYWDDLDPEVERVALAALARLRDHGSVLVEVDLGRVKDAASDIFRTLVMGAFTDIENFLRIHVPSISLRELTVQIASRDVRAALEGKWRPSAADVLNAQAAARDEVCFAYRKIFRQNGIQALAFPTVVLPPQPIRDAGDDPDDTIELNGRIVSKFATMSRNTVPASGLGAPALSLPVGLTRNGLPVALELDGLPGNDSALLALGRVVEATIGRVPAPPTIYHPTPMRP